MFGKWKEWKGYAYAGSMFLIAVMQSLSLHQYFHIMMQIGMRIRTGIIGLVYEKVIDQETWVGISLKWGLGVKDVKRVTTCTV